MFPLAIFVSASLCVSQPNIIVVHVDDWGWQDTSRTHARGRHCLQCPVPNSQHGTRYVFRNRPNEQLLVSTGLYPHSNKPHDRPVTCTDQHHVLDPPQGSRYVPQSSNPRCIRLAMNGIGAEEDTLLILLRPAGYATIYVGKLDFDGGRLWQTNVGDFSSLYGYAGSLSIHGSLVIVAGDHQGGGFLAALRLATAEFVWRISCLAAYTYSSPIVANIAGRPQVLLAGARTVTDCSPNNGDKLRFVVNFSRSCVGTPVVIGDLVLASGAHSEKRTLCIHPRTLPEVVWKNSQDSYGPSLVVHKSLAYFISDDGIAYYWDIRTGDVVWKHRIGETFSSSPVIVGDIIYATGEHGQIFSIWVTEKMFDLLEEHQPRDEIVAATPCAAESFTFQLPSVRAANDRRRFSASRVIRDLMS